MLTKEITPEKIAKMKRIYEAKRDFLKPNRKTGEELDEYMRSRYCVTEIETDEAKNSSSTT